VGNADEQVASSPEFSMDAAREWTSEEMKSAKPYPMKAMKVRETKQGEGDLAPTGAFTKVEGTLPRDYKPGKDAGPLPTGGEASAQATGTLDPYWYSTFPYRAVGKVFFRDGGVAYVCSASVAVNNAVWTAGHCVFNASLRRWHTNWVFVPAYADGRAPYGQWFAKELWALNGWLNNGDLAYDIGMAVLYRDSAGWSISSRVGSLGYMANASRYQTFTNFGYPAQTPFNGQRMAWCQDYTRYIDYWRSPWRIGIACNMNGGSSGGPWLVSFAHNSYSGNYINGINSTVDRKPDATQMYTPYFGDGAINLYNTVQYR
jgi:V8-like Glu-specific endopeptidase